jgi:hypothetical protein
VASNSIERPHLCIAEVKDVRGLEEGASPADVVGKCGVPARDDPN